MNRIREIRKEKGIPLIQLARDAGISGAYLCDIERGNRRGKEKTLERIAEALGVSTEEIKEAG